MQPQDFHILVVDDTPENLQSLAALLRKEGYQLTLATDGLNALEAVNRTRFDLILLDIMMPHMDGYEVCEQLQDDPITAEIPVIFLTALSDKQSIVRGFKVGGVDYISKPFHFAEMRARVRTHLELAYTRHHLQRVNQQQHTLLHLMCHDLSNPVTSMTVQVENMRHFLQQADGVMLEKTVERLRLPIRHMRQIIEMTRIGSAFAEGKLKLNPAAHLAHDLLQEAALMLEVQFRQKNIVPNVNVAEGVHLWVDRNAFVHSVLTNLLTNAIKFSPKQASVEVEAHPLEDGRVRVTVRDYGVGMTEEKLATVFDPTSATTEMGTEGEIGTGFGLPLVKTFVENFQGEIRLQSPPPEHPELGGTFVELILHSQAPPAPEEG